MSRSFIKNVKKRKERRILYKERKRTQRTPRSFIKDVKEPRECFVLFIKNPKEREKNVCPTLQKFHRNFKN